jgi:hypothetical protein
MYDYSLWVINVASTVSITKGNTCTGQKTWQKKAQSHLSGSMVACWPKGSHIGVLVCPEPPDIAGGLYLSGLERARRKDRDREDSRAYFSASRWRWWGGNSRSRNSKETTGTAGLMSAWAAAGKSSCKVHLMLCSLSPCRHLSPSLTYHEACVNHCPQGFSEIWFGSGFHLLCIVTNGRQRCLVTMIKAVSEVPSTQDKENGDPICHQPGNHS